VRLQVNVIPHPRRRADVAGIEHPVRRFSVEVASRRDRNVSRHTPTGDAEW
jgi:hypothetical protein